MEAPEWGLLHPIDEVMAPRAQALEVLEHLIDGVQQVRHEDHHAPRFQDIAQIVQGHGGIGLPGGFEVVEFHEDTAQMRRA